MVQIDCYLEEKEIPTDIPNGKTPVRGVVKRKKRTVIFDEVFYVNTEDQIGRAHV